MPQINSGVLKTKNSYLIQTECDQYNKQIKKSELKKWLNSISNELNHTNIEISIFFCSEDTMKNLNNQYRKIDSSTDVLSFSQIEEYQPNKSRHTFLGDIVISISDAKKNATIANHSLNKEISFLLLHGYLHLLGYDHEIDDGEMEKLQNNIYFNLTGENLE